MTTKNKPPKVMLKKVVFTRSYELPPPGNLAKLKAANLLYQDFIKNGTTIFDVKVYHIRKKNKV